MAAVNKIYLGVKISAILSNYEKLIKLFKNKNIKMYVQSTIQCEIAKTVLQRVKVITKLYKKLERQVKIHKVTFFNLKKLLSKSAKHQN